VAQTTEDIKLNNYDNAIAKKEPVLRNKRQDDTPSTSRATTASKLSPIERLAISIKNKIGVNISTEESRRILNSIPAEKDSEETPKSLIEALNKKKDKRPDLNIGEKLNVARSKKALKITDSGIEVQKDKIRNKDKDFHNYLYRAEELLIRINKKFKSHYWLPSDFIVSKLVEKYSDLLDDIRILEEKIQEDKSALASGRMFGLRKSRLITSISNMTAYLEGKKEETNELTHYITTKLREQPDYFKDELPKSITKDIEKYKVNASELLSQPNRIKGVGKGIERLQEFRETVITTVENSENILLMSEVRDAMKLANEVLENESKKHDEQLNEINRDMKDIQIKEDVINTLIANHNGQNKNVDTEEKDIIFPTVPQHEPEPNSNVVLEDTLRHKTKSNKKTAVLE
jgi:hypothetical protein